MIPHPLEILYGAGTAVACGFDGELHAEELHGFFAGDTRVLSTYRVNVGGRPWRLLGRSPLGSATAQWEYENRPIRDSAGDIPAGTLLLSLRRRLDGALHDDLHIRVFDRPVQVQLTLQLDADFADIFEVKSGSIVRRGRIATEWSASGQRLRTTYRNADFMRSLTATAEGDGTKAVYANGRISFEVSLAPGEAWHCCR